MRVTLDATPLLGARTGVARYVEGLLNGLTSLPEPPEIVLTAFTGRAWRRLVAPPGCAVAGRPVPARVLRMCWAHSTFPPVEWLAGQTDVFHATNFVLPPTRQAAGVLTVHDLSFLRDRDTVTRDVRAYRRLVARGVGWATTVVTPTAAVADEVAAEYGLPRAGVRAVHLGIDPAWSATRAPSAQEKAALGLPPEYIVAVGTVEPRKNLPLLISAHRMLPAAPPLVLVGDVRWAGGIQAGPGVHLTGYLPEKDLRHIVAGARVLAYPSRREGFGLPPLEALACGVPVVVSDLPALREVLTEHARFVAVGDAEALAAGLAAALREDRTAAAGAAGRAHAASFTTEHFARRMMQVYRQTVAR
ncbi:MAG: glycosyltransferase family 4 protein [Frankiaceae bacterium]